MQSETTKETATCVFISHTVLPTAQQPFALVPAAVDRNQQVTAPGLTLTDSADSSYGPKKATGAPRQPTARDSHLLLAARARRGCGGQQVCGPDGQRPKWTAPHHAAADRQAGYRLVKNMPGESTLRPLTSLY